MRIVCCNEVDISKIDPDSKCRVYLMHVQIDDVEDRAKEMIEVISSTSWIEKLSVVESISFKARAERTINKLVNEIFSKVSASNVGTDFGEYMVSMSAQDSLMTELKHSKIPLAELFKEKVSGNPGFDFHSESAERLITFGEAKYSEKDNPYTNALSQICEFIELKKDDMELVDLKCFVSAESVTNAIQGERAYAAAFSINSENTGLIFKNALGSEYFKNLLVCSELYLIGVEIVDK